MTQPIRKDNPMYWLVVCFFSPNVDGHLCSAIDAYATPALCRAAAPNELRKLVNAGRPYRSWRCGTLE